MPINPLKFVKETEWNYSSNNKLISHIAIESRIDKWETYQFQGRNIPRVSDILKKCLGKDYLINWAARLGIDEYKRESARTLYIGSIVHEVIEEFLLTGNINIPFDISNNVIRNKIKRSVNNFINWYHSMIEKGYSIKILAIEKQITNPWYGGTIDCIMMITNIATGISKVYIVDFKTSKSISIDYLLQTYSYLWSIKWNKMYIDPTLPDIDGIGIIRIDKESDRYQDLFLDYENNCNIIQDIDYSFTSMINWYYQTIIMEYNLKLAKKGN